MNNIFYFDNFYDNPLEIRKYAISREYTSLNNGFTGLEFVSNDIDIPSIMDKIASLIGRNIQYTRTQGVFRSLNKTQYKQKIKHVHIDRMGFSAVICLNESYDDGSTEFYQHKPTKLYGIYDKEALTKAALEKKCTEEELVNIIDVDFNSMKNWELIKNIKYKFNRIIIFDTDIFHLAGKGFGENIINSKLTQNFNFYYFDEENPLKNIFFKKTKLKFN